MSKRIKQSRWRNSRFHFKDPDGHNLEIIYFPSGKGAPRWQTNIDRALRSTDIYWAESYRRKPQSRTEQEHLNNVAGARLRITGLKAANGPGIEFLEYLAPRTGRPAPAVAALISGTGRRRSAQETRQKRRINSNEREIGSSHLRLSKSLVRPWNLPEGF